MKLSPSVKWAFVSRYPHGTLSVYGRKTLFVLDKPALAKEFLVLENNHALGIVKLSQGREEDKTLLSIDQHRINGHMCHPKEILSFSKNKLWTYSICPVKEFPRPVPVKIKGAGTWIKTENVWFPIDIEMFEEKPPLLVLENALRRGEVTMEILSKALANYDGKQQGTIATSLLSLLNGDGTANDIDKIKQSVSSLPAQSSHFISEVLSSFYEIDTFQKLDTPGIRPPETTLPDILELFKNPAILYHDAVVLTGSTANKGEGYDADILVRKEVGDENWKRVAFRISRACKGMPNVKFHVIKDDGPFTSFVPLYHIALIPAKREIIEMQKKFGVNTEPMKPIRVETDGESELESFLDLIEKQEKEGYSQPKYDGVHVFIISKEGKIKVITEHHQNITSLIDTSGFPSGSYVLDGELEAWKDGNHMPREFTAGLVHSKKKADEFTITVFDCLEKDNDNLMRKPFEERLKALKEVTKGWEETMDKPKGKLVRAPTVPVSSKKDLRKAINAVLKRSDKEGVVWKAKDGIYRPGGPNKGEQIKWHRNAVIEGTVLERHETKTKGVYNYTWGIDQQNLPAKKSKLLNGKKYLVVGKTFSTKKKLSPGDEVRIEAEQINVILENGKIDVGAWAPKILAKET